MPRAKAAPAPEVQEPVEKSRAASHLGCPGCVAVDRGDRVCSPGNLKFCVSAKAKLKGWKAGTCEGCLLIADGNPCQSGNAKKCAVAWERNKP